MDDELDIELQDADDIGARIILLSAIGFWPGLESQRDHVTWMNWMRNQGVLDIATDAEHHFLSARSLSEEDLDRSRSAFDAIWALGWCVHLHEQGGFALSSGPMNELIENLPTPGDPLEPFLDSVLLRIEDDIAVERERAEVWNWRLGAEIMARSRKGRGEVDLREAIAEVVLECSVSDAFPDVDGRDFLVEETRVADLDSELLEVLMVASDEQLRALNWVCGLTDWESIQIDE
jgi:hypothetical protein